VGVAGVWRLKDGYSGRIEGCAGVVEPDRLKDMATGRGAVIIMGGDLCSLSSSSSSVAKENKSVSVGGRDLREEN
jgi:hypothetical protein